MKKEIIKLGCIFLVDEESPAATQVIRKMSKNFLPGAIIHLTKEEFESLDRIAIIQVGANA